MILPYRTTPMFDLGSNPYEQLAQEYDQLMLNYDWRDSYNIPQSQQEYVPSPMIPHQDVLEREQLLEDAYQEWLAQQPEQAATKREPTLLDFKEYKIRKGDSLSKIAAMHGMSPTQWKKLAEINGLSDPNIIKTGQVLYIPKDWKAQQSVGRIGRRHIEKPTGDLSRSPKSSSATGSTGNNGTNGSVSRGGQKTYSLGDVTSKVNRLPEVTIVGNRNRDKNNTRIGGYAGMAGAAWRPGKPQQKSRRGQELINSFRNVRSQINAQSSKRPYDIKARDRINRGWNPYTLGQW